MTNVTVRAALAGALLLCIAAAPAAAQVDVGLKGGLNLSKFTVDPEEPGVDFPYSYGPTGGVFVTAGSGAVAAQIEALYSRKGSKVDESGTETLFKLDYVDIPLLIRFNGAPANATTFFVNVGPTIGVNFRARREDADGNESDIKDEVEQIEYGLTVGVGAQVDALVIEGRYTHGLSNIPVEDGSEDIRHRTFSLLLGFAF